MPYRRGDYKVICDRCGFMLYRSQAKKTWDGLIVCSKCWEPRHPQLSVRAKKDKIRVPEARPDPDRMDREITLASAASKGDTTVTVSDVTNISAYDSIGIQTDDTGSQPTTTGTDSVGSSGANIHWTYVTAISGSDLTIAEELPYDAASGNTVYIRGESHLTWTEVATSNL